MILILSDKNDSHANYLIERLDKELLRYYRLNLDVESLQKTEISYKEYKWNICQDGRILELERVKCVWNRRTFVELLLEEEYNLSVDFKIWKNEWNKTLLGIYSSIRSIPWLNPWREAYKAENKYLQMELAIKFGLTIPETIVSNKKADLQLFAKENEDVALKLMHQDFYKQKEGEFKGLYVNKITQIDLDRFGNQSENPVVLQKYIEKDFEVRYTVIGDNHFVCKIDSQKSKTANIDWRRYDIPNTPHEGIEPPIEIKTSVRNLMAELEIEYGALDFIVDKSKNWVFLEVNSLGQYLWIEDLTGLPISQAIIDWMKSKL